MSALTQEEIATLDAACAIIAAHTPVEGSASWSISFNMNGVYGGSCYFDSTKCQHMFWQAKTLSDVVSRGIESEANAEKDAAKLKAAKIDRLRDELAILTGEVAA